MTNTITRSLQATARGCLGLALAVAGAVALILATDHVAQAAATSPYPASTHIAGISFRWDTHRRLAPGSDNWPLTWSADGHQYTSVGDGGGFGGARARAVA